MMDLQAPSVHYLTTTLMDEILSKPLQYPKGKDSTIYDLENLDNDEIGLLLDKGLKVKCPIDGKMGAAYVHTLRGADNVGIATHMLSYTWGYKIGDIIECLEDYCVTAHKDPKRTYVWICCFCVNQHRVWAKKKNQRSGILVLQPPTSSTASKTKEEGTGGTGDDDDNDANDDDADTPILQIDFAKTFGERVKSIGHLLVMMSPYHQPTYLTRVWCIFEFYMALVNHCDVSVIMPIREKLALKEDLLFGGGSSSPIGGGEAGRENKGCCCCGGGESTSGLDTLYKILGKTRVQDAKASVESDRILILNAISEKNGPGYATLNRQVNKELRNWIRTVLVELAEDIPTTTVPTAVNQLEEKSNHKDRMLSHAQLCKVVGNVLFENGEFDVGLKELEKAFDIFTTYSPDQEEDPRVVSTLIDIARVLYEKGDDEPAKDKIQLAIQLQEKDPPRYGLDAIADSYIVYGDILHHRERDREASLLAFEKALAYQEQHLLTLGNVEETSTDAKVALIHDRLGLFFQHIGDIGSALTHYRKSLSILDTIQMHFHPQAAQTHRNMGYALSASGQQDDALVVFYKAKDILALLEGEDHHDNVWVHLGIAGAFLWKGDHKAALEELEQALAISRGTYGEEHDATADMYSHIAQTLADMKQFAQAVSMMEKVISIYELNHGADSFQAGDAYFTLGTILFSMGQHDDSLLYFRKTDAAYDKKRETMTINPKYHDTNGVKAFFHRVIQWFTDIDQRTLYLKTLESVFGTDEWIVWAFRFTLGDHLNYNGESRAALVQYEKALEISVKLFGEGHRGTNEVMATVQSLKQKVNDSREPNMTSYQPSLAFSMRDLRHSSGRSTKRLSFSMRDLGYSSGLSSRHLSPSS